jgi:hypothetical protein
MRGGNIFFGIGDYKWIGEWRLGISEFYFAGGQTTSASIRWLTKFVLRHKALTLWLMAACQ